MAHNWKSERVIAEMRVIKLPGTLVFFLDNVFSLAISRWMIVHRRSGITGIQHGISRCSQTFTGQTQHSVSLLRVLPGQRMVMQDVSISVARRARQGLLKWCNRLQGKSSQKWIP